MHAASENVEIINHMRVFSKMTIQYNFVSIIIWSIYNKFTSQFCYCNAMKGDNNRDMIWELFYDKYTL